MGALNEAKATIVTDSKAFRNDFMQTSHGKDYSKDNLTRQVPGMSRKLSDTDIERLYRDNSIAQNIVDIPAEDLTRSGWTIHCKDDKLKDLIESKLRQLKTKDRVKQAYRYQRMYGDGFISLGLIQNNKFDLAEPVDFNDIKSVSYLSSFSRKKVSGIDLNEDVFSPRYGDIEYVRIKPPNKKSSGIILLKNEQEPERIVHYSRLIHQQDIRLEDELYGLSLLESLYDIITVSDTALWSVGQMLYDYVFKVFKSRDVRGLSSDDKAELGMLMDYKFKTEALAIIDSEESLTKESTATAGIGDLLDYVWDYLAGAAKMPKTVLKGQESGTISGAQYDVMNYYSRIASIQENSLRPQLEYLVRLLLWSQDDCGPSIDPDSIEWSIEFNPLWNVDSKTDAEIRKLTAETDKIYIESGVLDPEEIHDTRFGRFGVTESSKFNADAADIDQLANAVYERYLKERDNETNS